MTLIRHLFYVKQLKKASLVKHNMNIYQNKERKLIWLAYRGNAIQMDQTQSKGFEAEE